MKDSVTVLYGSQMGAAKELAGRAADDLIDAGISAMDVDLAEYTIGQFRDEEWVLVITSTWAEGEPPDDCLDFYEAFTRSEPLGIRHVKFAVLALGDSSYKLFCKHGRDLDEHFERHGARRLRERVDCDMDEQEKYPVWIREMIGIVQAELVSLKASA